QSAESASAPQHISDLAVPRSFDEFPDPSTALRAAHERDAWNVFPDAKDAFQSQKTQRIPGAYPTEGPVPSVAWTPTGDAVPAPWPQSVPQATKIAPAAGPAAESKSAPATGN